MIEKPTTLPCRCETATACAHPGGRIPAPSDHQPHLCAQQDTDDDDYDGACQCACSECLAMGGHPGGDDATCICPNGCTCIDHDEVDEEALRALTGAA